MCGFRKIRIIQPLRQTSVDFLQKLKNMSSDKILLSDVKNAVQAKK